MKTEPVVAKKELVIAKNKPSTTKKERKFAKKEPAILQKKHSTSKRQPYKRIGHIATATFPRGTFEEDYNGSSERSPTRPGEEDKIRFQIILDSTPLTLKNVQTTYSTRMNLSGLLEHGSNEIKEKSRLNSSVV